MSIKKIWEGINSLLNKRRNRESVSKIKKPDNSGFTRPITDGHILNASIGHKLAGFQVASIVTPFSWLLSSNQFPQLSLFCTCDPVWGSTRSSVHTQQQSTWSVFVSNSFLKSASSILSYLLANILKLQLSLGVILPNLNTQK